MKKIQFFCDICGKEFLPQEYSFLTGQVIKIDKELKSQTIVFEGHYCGVCTNLILDEAAKLREKNATNNNPK